MPTVSIVIPFFNRKNLLQETIESVLSQTFSDWETLLIDDGSTDGAKEIALHYAKLDKRIIYLKRPDKLPKGAPSCRNYGMAQAKGKFLMFLDSDDLLLPYCLQQRITAAEQYPEHDAWIFQTLKVRHQIIQDYKQQLLNSKTHFHESLHRLPDAKIWNTLKTTPIEQFLQLDSPWHTSAGLWNTQALKRNNIKFDHKLLIWQDVDFHLNALTQNLSLKILLNYPPDVIYRIHSQTISQKGYPASYRKSQIYFLEKWAKRLPSYLVLIKKRYKNLLQQVVKQQDLRSIFVILSTKSSLISMQDRFFLLKSSVHLLLDKLRA